MFYHVFFSMVEEIYIGHYMEFYTSNTKKNTMGLQKDY